MQQTRDEHQAEAWAALLLSRLPGVGAAAFRRLLARYGTPRTALAAAPSGLVLDGEKSATVPGLRRAESFLSEGGTVLYLGGPGYPAPLAQLGEPPPVLFVRGAAALLEGPLVGIVGARRLDDPGRAAAYSAGATAAALGLVVVSGGALGVDACAHRAALDLGYPTVAVLGTGIDLSYPPEHGALFAQIAEQGALVSELLPGAPPIGSFFATRNRIIAGLSRGVLVARAGIRSGALRTGRGALRAGRLLGAMLGPRPEELDLGCRELVRLGARPISESRALLRFLQDARQAPCPAR